MISPAVPKSAADTVNASTEVSASSLVRIIEDPPAGSGRIPGHPLQERTRPAAAGTGNHPRAGKFAAQAGSR